MNISDKINSLASECEENEDTFLIVYSDETPENSELVFGGNGVVLVSGIAKTIMHMANMSNVSPKKVCELISQIIDETYEG